MKLRVCLLAICSLVVATVALAQSSVDGKWMGEFQGGRGPQQIALTLKAEGGKLTGQVTGGRGGEIAVDEGTISGDTLKFKTTQMGRGGQITFNWSGMLKGDEIMMKRMVEGREDAPAQEFTLKREK
jgi:hypothetical protein